MKIRTKDRSALIGQAGKPPYIYNILTITCPYSFSWFRLHFRFHRGRFFPHPTMFNPSNFFLQPYSLRVCSTNSFADSSTIYLQDQLRVPCHRQVNGIIFRHFNPKQYFIHADIFLCVFWLEVEEFQFVSAVSTINIPINRNRRIKWAVNGAI
jgi:hypothetical protein